MAGENGKGASRFLTCRLPLVKLGSISKVIDARKLCDAAFILPESLRIEDDAHCLRQRP
jgi:hypothetical protein